MPDVNAVAVATLTGYTNPDGYNVKVHVTSAAAITATPAGGQAAITLTPAAEQLPYTLPFLVSSVDATTVATFVVTF